ncbi:Asp-tRNA(Asn)/Glu-tRNA(Gln) amidotransferase subunit GatA [Marinicella sp. W31]|uniref:Asp-tRNA(Asn)/Glu-tRNA(Gln) amidotransferase subunit GatA n=1 Tax=Marinicella sp. W31 TaxID=3023713 RepID=UPI0037579881
MIGSSLLQIAEKVRSGSVSVAELTAYYQQRIQQHNPTLNAFIHVKESPESPLAEATPPSPLHGIPMAHKDLFCTRDMITSCGSAMLKSYVSPYDATVVSRLQEQGAVCLGKTNMDEFAMGSSNENSYFGAVANPWNHEHVPGGSSGGSAAAVAARLVPYATATDTGGSIRQPAAFCGITGIKPSYGRVSRYGMVAFASSLDQAGVLAPSAEDCALVLQAMMGHDPQDSTSINESVPSVTEKLDHSVRGMKVGVVREWIEQLQDAEIKAATEESLRQLVDLGAELVDVSLPHAHLAVSAYYILAPAECSSNLSRFDGVRFGHQSDQAEDLQALYANSRSEGFGQEVKRRILTGTWALSAGYYDAYYVKAQRIRRLIAEDFKKAFSHIDVLACPVSPEVAFAKGAKSDPVSMYQSDVFTIPASLAGLPCLSMPIGFSQGLPVGLQLIGRYLDEASILKLAHQYQQVTEWHQCIPEGYDD